VSVKELSTADFKYWKDYNQRDIQTHEDEFLREANPDLMHALYRGYKDPAYRQNLRDPAKLRNHILAYSKIFTATNTIIPNLMYQMPRYLVVPEFDTDPVQAAAMTAALNKYNKVLKQKMENQQAVLNTWFLGLSWKKIGYYIPESPKVDEPETEGAEAAEAGQPQGAGLQFGQLQHTYQKESPFNSFESPVNVLIDHKGTLHNFKVITNRLVRTLQDLIEYGQYDPEQMQKLMDENESKNGSRFDAREVKFTLNEKMIEQRNGIWLLVWVDEFDEPLYYEKMDVDEIPYYPLEFTNEPNIRYPVSHMGVASRSQRWIDELASRYVEMIGKTRAQHYINEEILAKGQSKESFLKNLIGGIYWGKRPAQQGDIVEVKSSQITPDVMNIINMLTSNVTEILGADNQRISGQSKNETLGQDKLASIGTEIRESGMLDKVRDWLIAQGDCMTKILQKHSGAELKLQIGQNDFQSQEAAQGFMGDDRQRTMEFRTPNQPMPLSSMAGDGTYDVTINVYEAVKPNKRELANEYDEFIATYSTPLVKDALLQSNKIIRLDLVTEERAKLFEYLDTSRFIETIDIRQKTAIQVQDMIKSGAVNGGATPLPTGTKSTKSQATSSIPETPQEVPVGA